MTNPFQPNLRKPWLLLCISTALTYAVVPVRSDSLFDPNAISFWLETIMFGLAFPLGDLLALAFYTGDGGIIERFLLWSMALAVGYAQWFHIFPALLRGKTPRVTTLNLAAVGNVALESGPAAQTGPASRETKPLAAPTEPPVPQFNDRGLTPLERILRDEGE